MKTYLPLMMARDKRTFPTVLTQGPVNRMKRRGIRTITSSRLSVRDQAIAAMRLSNAGLSFSLVDQMSKQYTTCNLPTYRGFKQDRSCDIHRKQPRTFTTWLGSKITSEFGNFRRHSRVLHRPSDAAMRAHGASQHWRCPSQLLLYRFLRLSL